MAQWRTTRKSLLRNFFVKSTFFSFHGIFVTKYCIAQYIYVCTYTKTQWRFFGPTFFREINVLTKEVIKDLISRNFFDWSHFVVLFHIVNWQLWKLYKSMNYYDNFTKKNAYIQIKTFMKRVQSILGDLPNFHGKITQS